MPQWSLDSGVVRGRELVDMISKLGMSLGTPFASLSVL